MTDPHQPEQSADEEAPGQGQGQDPTSEGSARETPSGEGQGIQAEDTQSEGSGDTLREIPSGEGQGIQAEDTQSEGNRVARLGERKAALLVGFGVGVLASVVVLVLAAFVWPGFHSGPGKPDNKAAEVVTALSSKDPAQVDKVSCHAPDGKSAGQMAPQVLQLIQAAKQTGPPHLSLDTQALAPVQFTLSAQGQTQNVAVDVVLAVTNGAWCMDGISQRQ
jgi:hypothetical protein